MGRIQSDIGLITGVPITDTVDKLMALAARPRDMLVEPTDALKEEQAAVTELTTLLATIQFAVRNLAKADLYDRRSATSSNPDVLSATASQSAPTGRYQITPLRLVRYQQLLGSPLASKSAPLGAGTLRFRLGRSVRTGLGLSLLEGGNGFVRGQIRITDRSGTSAVIDLSSATSLDEVIEAINGNTTVNVQATIEGDRIRLTDYTGQAVSNLRVQEVAGGSTAASLGLAAIDVAADTALGADIVRLDEKLDLTVLNDGNGVHIDRFLPDIEYHLRDGTTGTIDLDPLPSGEESQSPITTLGDVIEVINNAAPGKLKLEIAPDGDRLQLVDLTSGTDEFTVRSLNSSSVVEHLGLDGVASDGVITGRRLIGGLATVLLSSLGGGKGLGTLGQISITDRSGASATVDLSGAETLHEVIEAINSAGVGIVARVNQPGNGIELVDTTGEAASNLIVANADETQTADKLGIAVDAAVTSVSSGDLHLQVISHSTRLRDLNGGNGVARSTFNIFDSAGKKGVVDLSADDVQTIGDVIRKINNLGIGVVAELNETGDGIRIRDTAAGGGTLRVTEGGSTAADLHLLGTATELQIDGQPVQVIDGSFTYTVELDDDDTLEDLRDKINQLDAGLTASILNDGSAQPYRLVLQSQRAGEQGNWVVDGSDLGLNLAEVVRGADALVRFGEGSSALLVSAHSNRFTELVPGVTVEIKQPSETTVTVTVSQSDTDLVATVRTLVDNYNKFRDSLDKYTAYDPETNQANVLTGDATAARLDTELLYLLSGTFSAGGRIVSLRQLGVSLLSDGTLSFDESALRSAYSSDPLAVQEFFTDETSGFAKRLDDLLEQLAGEGSSLLASRIEALSAKIDENQQRIDTMNQRLSRQREQLLLEFYRMELAVAKILSAQSYIQNIKPIRITPRRSDED